MRKLIKETREYIGRIENGDADLGDWEQLAWLAEPLANALEVMCDRLDKLSEVLTNYDEFWDGAPEDGWRFHRDVAKLIEWQSADGQTL